MVSKFAFVYGFHIDLSRQLRKEISHEAVRIILCLEFKELLDSLEAEEN